MPITAEIEGAGQVEFPDDATPEEITKAVNAQFPAKKQEAAPMSPENKKLYDELEGMKKEAGEIGERTQRELASIQNPWTLVNAPMTYALPESMRKAFREEFAGPESAILGKALGEKSTLGKVIRGAHEGAANIGESLVSPLGISTVGAGPLLAKAPRAIQALLGAAFSVQGVKQGSQSYVDMVDAAKKGDWESAAKNATELVGAGAQTAMGAHQFRTGAMSAVNRIREIPASADILPRARAATEAIQTEKGAQNAPVKVQQQESVQTQRGGNGQGGTPSQAGGSGSVLNPAASQAVAPQAQVPLTAGDRATQLSTMPVDQFHKTVKQFPGGLTEHAYDLGQSVKTEADLKALKDAQASASAEAKTLRAKNDLTGAIAVATKGQYFREAYEAATGTGSAGKTLRERQNGYQPPAPEGKFPATKPTPAETIAQKAETKPAQAATQPPLIETGLSPEHADWLDEERKAIDHPVEVVSGEPVPGELNPFAGQIAHADKQTGKIMINAQELTKWLNSRERGGVPAGKEREAIRSLLSEEAIHLSTPDASAEAYYNSATPAERAIAQRIYAGPGAQPMSPRMLGHEMVRQRLQKLARMSVRETLEASTRERWTVKTLLALNDAIRTAREVLGTQASKEGRAIIDQVQDNIDAAIAAKEGKTAPEARRKKPDEKTGEFFLPPVKEPLPPSERPSASELGALPEQKIPPEKALQTDTFLWNKPNAWRRVTNELLHKPYSLGKMLTEGSRATEADPVSLTRRLVALEKNGKVDVVSIYPDSEDGARLVDPAYAGKRKKPNVPIKSLLDEGYRPIVSMLRHDPVQNFHRRFDSVEQFEQTVGKPGDDQWANVQGYEPQTAATQAPSFGQGNEMTDAEAMALHDHFIEHDTVDKAADAIAASPNVRQIRSALGKAINQIMADNSGLTREEAAGRAFTQLYEQAQNSAGRNEFVQGALGRFGQESPESAGHQPPETVAEPQPGAEEPSEELPEGGTFPVNAPEIETGETGEIDPDLPLLRQGPQAIRKFAQDQVKLTEDEIRAFVAGSRNADQIARRFDAAENLANNTAASEEMNIRLASMEKPTGIVQRFAQRRGNREVLSAANAMVQAQAVRRNGTIDNARIGQLAVFEHEVQRGIQEATRWTQSQDLRQKLMGQKWLRSQQQLLNELQYARANWNDPALQETARRMKRALDQQWLRERQAGIDVRKDDNYTPQRYDAAVWNEHSILFNAIPGTEKLKILGRQFRRPKTFPSYYHASAEGPYIPASRDGASLVSHRVRQGMRMIERQSWVNGLKGMTTSGGQPVAADVKVLANGSLQTPGRNYKAMVINGKNVAIHDEYRSLIRNLTIPSLIDDWAVTRGALRLEQQLKHGLLIGDFFHFGRVGYYAASIMGRQMGWRGGWAALDIKPQNMREAVAKGIISQENADWATGHVRVGNRTLTRQQLAQEFVRHGANLGVIQDALYKDLITEMTPAAGPIRRGVQRVIDPSVGRWNRFLFDNFTRGIMAESNVREFERVMKERPYSNPDRVMDDIARDVNNYFGNIGKQGWAKSATMKDLSRFLLLAPDWFEGLVKKESAFAGRATGVSKLAGRREGVSMLGTTGRGIGRGLVFLLGLTQAINLITRRQPTWKNEEEGHKFDAWIPSWNGSGEGFWFSPFAMFNELTHDVWRYANGNRTLLNSIDQVGGNHFSPITHAAIIAGAGALGPQGQKFNTSMGQLKASAKQIAPVPITFGRFGQLAGHAIAPSVVSPPPPGSVQRQALSSLGMKVEPKMDAVQEITEMAKRFAKDQGFDKESGWEEVPVQDEPSYSKLRGALRDGDEAGAKKVLEQLRKTHTDKQIFRAMKAWKARPFAGSHKAERAFVNSLDDRQLDRYFQATTQREAEYQSWQDFALRQQ